MSPENLPQTTWPESKEASSQDVEDLAKKTWKQVQEKLKSVLTKEGNLKKQFLTSGREFLKGKNLSFILNMKDYRSFDKLLPDEKKVYKMCYFLTGLEKWITNPFLSACQEFINSLTWKDQSQEVQSNPQSAPQSVPQSAPQSVPQSAPQSVPQSAPQSDLQPKEINKDIPKNSDKLPYLEAPLLSEKELMPNIYERIYADGSRDRRVGNKEPYQAHYGNTFKKNFTLSKWIIPTIDGQEVPIKYVEEVDSKHFSVFSLKKLGLTKEQLSGSDGEQKILSQLQNMISEEFLSKNVQLRNIDERGFDRPQEKDKKLSKMLRKYIVPIVVESLQNGQSLIIPRPEISSDYIFSKSQTRTSAQLSWALGSLSPIVYMYLEGTGKENIYRPIYKKRNAFLPEDEV